MNFTRTMIGAAVGATMATSAMAADDDMAALKAELKRLAQRIETLERHNKELEQGLATDRVSEREPELATRLKAVEFQSLSMQKQARQIGALEGISVSTSLTSVMQGVGASGTATGADESRANYRGDIAISLPGGKMGDIEGKIFTHLRLGQGEGVPLRPTYTSTANTTAFQTNAGPDDSFAILAQAWYQLEVPLPRDGIKANSRERLNLTFGKIDPFVFFDQNGAADDETTKFMNNAFVHNPLLDSGGDIGADEYGFQPGFIAKYENSHQKGQEWAVSIGSFASHTGADFSGSFSDPFVIGQIETNARFAFLPGTYRVYAWTNGRAQVYDATERRNSGWGISVDQKVVDELTLFGRYGHHTNGKVKFDRALTLGAELEGTPWRRSADSVGIAYGRLETSNDYRADSLGIDGYQASGSEYQGEIYYRFKLNDNVELTPSYQWIGNPGGDESAGTIKVAGFRAKLGF